MTKKLSQEFLNSLNPGIRKTVMLLNQHGFKTVDSGDGATHEFGCDRDVGYVSCLIEDHSLNMALEANRVLDLLEDHGVKFEEVEGWGELPAVQVTFNPRDGLWFLDIHGITDSMLELDDV